MWDKKKLASMMVIGMAAMCMLGGCQKKKAQPESAQTETAQSETQAAQTEAAELYTSESNSFSMQLPDSGWAATKQGIENKWAFMKEGVGTIQITHKRSKIKAKNLPQSQEDAVALLNKIKENAFAEVEYKKDSTDSAQLYYYAASTQDTELGYVYIVRYLINTDTESYNITAKLTTSDSAQILAVKKAVTSFQVLNDDSKASSAETENSKDNSTSDGTSTGNSTSEQNNSQSDASGSADGAEGTSRDSGTDEEYRYFFDANGNTIYAYPFDDGTWRDENGNAYTFLENGVQDENGTQYYYDPPQGQAAGNDASSGSSGSSDGMVIDFYDSNGNYITATQDANGNWVGSDGKTYTFDERGATDSDGNFSKW